ARTGAQGRAESACILAVGQRRPEASALQCSVSDTANKRAGRADALAPATTGPHASPLLLAGRQRASQHFLGRGLMVLHRARPLAPDGRVDLVAVVAELLQALLVFLGEHLLGQRLKVPDVVG